MRRLYIPASRISCAGAEKALKGVMAVAAIAVSTPGHAIDATTVPLGIYVVKVAGKPEGVPQARTYLGAQLLPATRFSGTVAAVNGASIDLGGVDLSSLGVPGGSFYCHVTTGNSRGLILGIEEFRTSDIRVSQDVTALIQPGDKLLIRPHPRMTDLFGVDNRFGLGAGTDPTTADNIVAWDPETQAERVFYFHSTRNRWEQGNSAVDAGASILRFPYGFYLVRRSSSPLRIVLSGEIGSHPVLLPVRTGTNVFSLPLNLSGKLGSLITSGGANAVVSGTNSREADLLTFEEAATGGHRGPFYHSTRPGAIGWRMVGDENASQTMDLLSTLILRRSGAPGAILAEGSLTLAPDSFPPAIPPDPDAGEVALTGTLPIPPSFPSGVFYQVQVSTDLRTWSSVMNVIQHSDHMSFPLPAGQSRGFYRLKYSL